MINEVQDTAYSTACKQMLGQRESGEMQAGTQEHPDSSSMTGDSPSGATYDMTPGLWFLITQTETGICERTLYTLDVKDRKSRFLRSMKDSIPTQQCPWKIVHEGAWSEIEREVDWYFEFREGVTAISDPDPSCAEIADSVDDREMADRAEMTVKAEATDSS